MKMLRNGKWRCKTRDAKGRIPLDLKHYPRKSQKKADVTLYWILYYTAVENQTPDKLKQNITKNPKHLISDKGKYSMEAYQTE